MTTFFKKSEDKEKRSEKRIVPKLLLIFTLCATLFISERGFTETSCKDDLWKGHTPAYWQGKKDVACKGDPLSDKCLEAKGELCSALEWAGKACVD